MVAKYTLKPTGKRKYHRDSTMSKAEVMLIMILFHDSGYRSLNISISKKDVSICVICFLKLSHTTV